MAGGFYVQDGNEALRDDIPAVIAVIERTARWVHPKTFLALPVWAPHTARGRPLYNSVWTRRYTNTRKATGITAEKFEGNIAALNSLIAALDVASPKPKNWTVCHIWGYDDPAFAQRSSVVQDPRYFSCVANMVWLPTSLKGFTDTLPVCCACARFIFMDGPASTYRLPIKPRRYGQVGFPTRIQRVGQALIEKACCHRERLLSPHALSERSLTASRGSKRISRTQRISTIPRMRS